MQGLQASDWGAPDEEPFGLLSTASLFPDDVVSGKGSCRIRGRGRETELIIRTICLSYVFVMALVIMVFFV